MDDQVAIGGIYAHYKSDRNAKPGDNYTYEVIGVARHTETDESLVVYKQLYDSENFLNGAIWARPLNGSKGFLEPEIRDGEEVQRFRLLG